MASIRTLAANRSGNVAMFMGLALPVLVGLGGAAVDYGRMSSLQGNLQKAADASALAATRELGVSSIADEQRFKSVARSVALAQLGLGPSDSTVQVEARANEDRSGIRVTVTRAFSPTGLVRAATGDFVVKADAVAKRLGGGKMCILVLSLKNPREAKALEVANQSQITGQDCGVFSNSAAKESVSVTGDASIKASVICSAGGYDATDNVAARYIGTRRTDCPVLENPLKDRPQPQAGPCSILDAAGKAIKLVVETSRVLLPGTYCGGIEIKGSNTVLTLQASATNNVFIIKDGLLKVTDDAKLVGRGVGFAFVGKDANFEFTKRSVIELYAPTEGPMAGILFFGSLDAPDWREYKITSDNARTLVGTIYLPKGYFTIDARNPVADLSAYTAVIVNKLKLSDAPRLVLNTNYHQTKVPVPKGVAETGGAAYLAQ